MMGLDHLRFASLPVGLDHLRFASATRPVRLVASASLAASNFSLGDSI